MDGVERRSGEGKRYSTGELGGRSDEDVGGAGGGPIWIGLKKYCNVHLVNISPPFDMCSTCVLCAKVIHDFLNIGFDYSDTNLRKGQESIGQGNETLSGSLTAIQCTVG